MQFTVPERAAVVVIDVQRGLFEANPPPAAARDVLGAIAETIHRARAAGRPIIFVQHDGSAQEGVEPHTPGWELHPDLPVAPEDPVVQKATCDAFYGTGLEEALRQRGIETVVLAGYATDFCIDSTLRAAVSRDFKVVVVADGHTTHDNPHLTADQVRAHHNWAWANCTTQVPVKVAAAGDLKFQ